MPNRSATKTARRAFIDTNILVDTPIGGKPFFVEIFSKRTNKLLVKRFGVFLIYVSS
jgi:hypothetical protein